MFAKRPKKIYPPGTFIPTQARVCAIIQLCLAFTVILWNLSEPFAGELFSIKSNLVLYHDVMGTPSNDTSLPEEKRERLKHNAKYFAELSEKQKGLILLGLQKNLDALQRTFFDKLKKSFTTLLIEIPPFEQAWVILSVLISIMLLKRIEGARQVIWLLPLLAALYAFDNRWYGQPPSLPADAQLFPSEQILIENYYKKPLSNNIFEQQAQLQEAWKIYLVKEWTPPAHNKELFESQVKRGEFAFNAARLTLIASKSPLNNSTHQHPQEPLPLLALYFFWNIFFACVACRSKEI